MIPSHDEVGTTVVLPDPCMENTFPWSGHPHRERDKNKHSVGLASLLPCKSNPVARAVGIGGAAHRGICTCWTEVWEFAILILCKVPDHVLVTPRAQVVGHISLLSWAHNRTQQQHGAFLFLVRSPLKRVLNQLVVTLVKRVASLEPHDDIVVEFLDFALASGWSHAVVLVIEVGNGVDRYHFATNVVAVLVVIHQVFDERMVGISSSKHLLHLLLKIWLENAFDR